MLAIAMGIGCFAAFFQWAKRKSVYKDIFFRHLEIFEQKLRSKTCKYAKKAQVKIILCNMIYFTAQWVIPKVHNGCPKATICYTQSSPTKNGEGANCSCGKRGTMGEKEMMQKSSARPSFPNGTHPAQPKAKDGG